LEQYGLFPGFARNSRQLVQKTDNLCFLKILKILM